MTTPPPVIVWFRRDLRLSDNQALVAACKVGPVIPLFILDEEPGVRSRGAASKWWLDKSLRALGEDIAGKGSTLVLRRGAPEEVLGDLILETGAGAVYWNRLYDPSSVERDQRIKADLRAMGLDARSFGGALLVEPWALKSGVGAPYRVFTPFWRAARSLADDVGEPEPAPLLPAIGRAPRSDRLGDWRLHPCAPDWSAGFGDWRPGEEGARARLTAFLDNAASAYLDRRDLPGLAGTSKLSPHLHFGEISARQVWVSARASAISRQAPDRHIEGFLRELGWREFNHHLLFHFPSMVRDGFNPRFRDFPWVNDPPALAAWSRGRTGYPIVDAGMRELWATGWMHNRVRMIVASFLVKDLMIDWRQGKSWFWDTLVDADPANNLGGWQWVAGLGADAAPYFRVFNPVRQSEIFDPDGDYVRRWVPELARLSNRCIHQPWRADRLQLAEAGVRLGGTYPAPIVDHARARGRALAAYERHS